MAKVGYLRVSSVGQSLESQRDRLEEAGADTLFEEKKSGADTKRPKLAECLRYVRKGDVLMVTKLDRLARSVSHLCSIREELEEKGVELQVLDLGLDTSTATGKLMFTLLGAIAEFELTLRSERQQDGIKAAQKRGVKFGRRAKLTDDQVQEIREKRASGILIKDLMKEYGLSKSSVYEYLKVEPG